MKVYSDPNTMKNALKKLGKSSIGFVPTMGALHKGHISLVEKSISENDVTVVSIFINPTQFNDKNDFAKYPKTVDKDLEILEAIKTDKVFIPEYETIYNYNYRFKITENDLSNKLCGKSRPGHFDGVLTIVMKLFNIIRPNKAYFGEKDFQQYKLISEMAGAFFLDVEIISLPTERDGDGLALSSRNKLLTSAERQLAPNFYETLNSNVSDEEAAHRLEEIGFNVDYIETIDDRRFGAVFLGNVRLIDNVKK